jgi:hypothetical protein
LAVAVEKQYERSGVAHLWAAQKGLKPLMYLEIRIFKAPTILVVVVGTEVYCAQLMYPIASEVTMKVLRRGGKGKVDKASEG